MNMAAQQAYRGRINDEQKNILLEFFESNPEFNAGILTRTFTHADRVRLWGEVTAILNTVGSGAQKDAEAWKATGGGFAAANPVTDFEERVAALMGHSTIFGISDHLEGPEVVFNRENPVAVAPQPCLPSVVAFGQEIVPDINEIFDIRTCLEKQMSAHSPAD